VVNRNTNQSDVLTAGTAPEGEFVLSPLQPEGDNYVVEIRSLDSTILPVAYSERFRILATRPDFVLADVPSEILLGSTVSLSFTCDALIKFVIVRYRAQGASAWTVLEWSLPVPACVPVNGDCPGIYLWHTNTVPALGLYEVLMTDSGADFITSNTITVRINSTSGTSSSTSMSSSGVGSSSSSIVVYPALNDLTKRTGIILVRPLANLDIEALKRAIAMELSFALNVSEDRIRVIQAREIMLTDYKPIYSISDGVVVIFELLTSQADSTEKPTLFNRLRQEASDNTTLFATRAQTLLLLSTYDRSTTPPSLDVVASEYWPFAAPKKDSGNNATLAQTIGGIVGGAIAIFLIFLFVLWIKGSLTCGAKDRNRVASHSRNESKSTPSGGSRSKGSHHDETL